MRVIIKHIYRNILQNRFRSLLIIFSLAVSTMVFYLNLSIKDDLFAKYEAILRGAYQDYDIVVSVDPSSGDDGMYLSDIDLGGVDSDKILTTCNAYGIYNGKGHDDNANTSILFVGTDRVEAQKDQLVCITDHVDDYDPTDSTQIIIGEKAAEKYDLALGDQIVISTMQGDVTLEIAAYAAPKGFFLMEAMEEDTFSVISTTAYCADLANISGKITSVYIDLPDSSSAKDVTKTLAEDNPSLSVSTLVDEDSIDSSLQMIHNFLTIILLVIIALNFYVISSITKMIMSIRIPVVGTFRSVGATKNKMNAILVLENALYGILGSILGVIAGALARDPISSVFMTTGNALNYVDVHYKVNLWFAFLSILFSVGLQILISLSSIIRTSRKSIKDSIFNTLSTKTHLSKSRTILGFVLLLMSVTLHFVNTSYSFPLSGIAFIFAMSGAVLMVPLFITLLTALLRPICKMLFGPVGEIASQNLDKSKINRSNIILVSVSLSLVLVMYICAGSVSALFDKFDQVYPYDILVYGMTEEFSSYSDIDSVSGVSEVSTTYGYFAETTLKDKQKSLCFIGADGDMSGIKLSEDLHNQLDSGEIIVDKYYAAKNGIATGDTLSFTNTEDTLVSDMSYTVIGYCDSSLFSSNRNIMVISQEDYTSKISTAPLMLGITLDKGEDIDAMVDTLTTKLAGQNLLVVSKTDYLGDQESSSQGLISMVAILMGLSLVLVVLGLVNNQLIGFNQKRKEYAVLYSVAMSKAQLMRMIFVEMLGAFLIGCTISLALSMWLTVLLSDLLFTIGLCMTLSVQAGNVLLLLLAVFLALCLTSLSPMRKIAKIKVVEEIKYE